MFPVLVVGVRRIKIERVVIGENRVLHLVKGILPAIQNNVTSLLYNML